MEKNWSCNWITQVDYQLLNCLFDRTAIDCDCDSTSGGVFLSQQRDYFLIQYCLSSRIFLIPFVSLIAGSKKFRRRYLSLKEIGLVIMISKGKWRRGNMINYSKRFNVWEKQSHEWRRKWRVIRVDGSVTLLHYLINIGCI